MSYIHARNITEKGVKTNMYAPSITIPTYVINPLFFSEHNVEDKAHNDKSYASSCKCGIYDEYR